MIKLVLLTAICFFQLPCYTCMTSTKQAEEYKEQKNTNESFPFFKLPLDIQKVIMSYVWESDYIDQAVEQKLNAASQARQTSVAESIKYGFNGFKYPINFLTFENNIPTVKEVGIILEEDAQPSRMNSYSHVDSRMQTAHLFLENPITEQILKAEIIISDDLYLHSAAFSVHGDIAVLWKQSNFLNSVSVYISYFSVEEVKNGSINLNNRKDISDLDLSLADKHIIFDISGTKTIIFTLSRKLREYVAKDYLDVPEPKKELTFVQQCKRLGLYTPAVTELFRKNREGLAKNSNPQ